MLELQQKSDHQIGKAEHEDTIHIVQEQRYRKDLLLEEQKHGEELKQIDKLHRGKMKMVYQEAERKMQRQLREQQKAHQQEIQEMKQIHEEQTEQSKSKYEKKQSRAVERFTKMFNGMESKRNTDVEELLDENKELHQKLKRCKSAELINSGHNSSYLDLEELD